MTPLLRSQLRDAAHRAFVAERSSKRARAELRNTRNTLGEALLDLDAARGGSAQLARVLRRLAARQLGDGATATEVTALVDRWVAEDPKATAKVVEAAQDAFTEMIARAFEPRLRGEENGHG